jgi:hypothetical protein
MLQGYPAIYRTNEVAFFLRLFFSRVGWGRSTNRRAMFAIGAKQTFVNWTEWQNQTAYAVNALKVMVVRVSRMPAMQCTFSLTKWPMSVPASA